MNRHLYRCRHDRRIAGVAAGVAEFFDLDVTLVRILWFLSIFVGGLGILLYIGLALIVPNEPLTADEAAAAGASAASGAGSAVPGGPVHVHGGSNTSGRVATFIGLGLILLGALALLDAYLPGWHSWRLFWPVFLVGIGAVIVAGAVRRDDGRPSPDDRPTPPAVPGPMANGEPNAVNGAGQP